MSKLKKRKKNKLLVGLLVALLLAAVIGILEATKLTDFIHRPVAVDTADGPTPEQEQTEADVNAALKQQLIEEEAKAAEEPPENDTPAASTKRIELSAKKESNNTVTVFTKLYNYSSGTCNLTVTNGSKSNSQTATVVYQPEYATCAGFSVPTSQLGTGTWNINLKVDSNGATTTKTIFFEVN